MIPSLFSTFLFAGKAGIGYDIATLLEEGATLLDVRTAAEYALHRVDGSVNLSIGRLHQDYLLLDHEAAYVVCCSDGRRSRKAVDLLQSHGFRRVYYAGPIRFVKTTAVRTEEAV